METLPSRAPVYLGLRESRAKLRSDPIRATDVDVAPAALASTLVTSIAGVTTFLVLSTHHRRSVAPDWTIGIALGAGGLAGGYLGARLQPRRPDMVIRRLLGFLVI